MSVLLNPLTLFLFMLGILTDDPDDPFASNDLALVTHLFDRSPYFHLLNPRLVSSPLDGSNLGQNLRTIAGYRYSMFIMC